MEHLNLVDMAETTHEMWSCHERAFSSAKQQSSSPHPMLCNCQGGSIPLPRCPFCGPEEAKVLSSRGHRVPASWLRGKEGAKHCISQEAWLLCCCSCSYQLICTCLLACKLGLAITSTFSYIHLEESFSRCQSQEAAM